MGKSESPAENEENVKRKSKAAKHAEERCINIYKAIRNVSVLTVIHSGL